MKNKKNIINDNQIFQPQPWRWFFYHLAINSVAAFLGILLASFFTSGGTFIYSVVGFLVGITIVTFLFSRHTEKWKITISAKDIEGPGKNTWKNVKFQIKQIDRQKSFIRSLYGRLLAFDYICSTTGQKIYVDSVSLGKEQVASLRSKLGM
jgi:hypothetical protein